MSLRGELEDLEVTVGDELAQRVRSARASARESIEESVARTTSRVRATAKTRKSAATRERIMSAASDIMVERGSTDFQMSEVSARCHMSKGALYYYFADKDALVGAVFDREVDDFVLLIEVTVARSTSAADAIVQLAELLSGALSPQGPLTLALMREFVSPTGEVLPTMGTHVSRIVSVFEAQLERGKAEGIVDPAADSHVAAIGLVGASSLLVLEHDALEDAYGSHVNMAHRIVGFLLRGVGTQRARDLCDAWVDAEAADAAKGVAPASADVAPAPEPVDAPAAPVPASAAAAASARTSESSRGTTAAIAPLATPSPAPA